MQKSNTKVCLMSKSGILGVGSLRTEAPHEIQGGGVWGEGEAPGNVWASGGTQSIQCHQRSHVCIGLVQFQLDRIM